MQKAWIPTECGILAAAGVVGKLEKEGPLGDCFVSWSDDDRFSQPTWEKAESEMQRLALRAALEKWGEDERALDAIFAGDLLNQCVGAAYGLKDFSVPYFGLYGACSTAAEGLILSAMTVTGGQLSRTAAVASSHNCTAERQYRSPIEYGGQRTPTAQWTVTGAGAFIVGECEGAQALIRGVCPGKVVEMGVRDVANMGAAMAPAAVDTLLRFFDATGCAPDDFDGIYTGDLGYEGGDILCELMSLQGVDIKPVYSDCGMMIYDRDKQDTHAGGSGCGCSASVLACHLLPRIAAGELARILLLGTGAMMSPQSIQQGLCIPAVAHLVCITANREGVWKFS